MKKRVTIEEAKEDFNSEIRKFYSIIEKQDETSKGLSHMLLSNIQDGSDMIIDWLMNDKNNTIEITLAFNQNENDKLIPWKSIVQLQKNSGFSIKDENEAIINLSFLYKQLTSVLLHSKTALSRLANTPGTCRMKTHVECNSSEEVIAMNIDVFKDMEEMRR